MISSISLFEVINDVPHPRGFFWIAASVADIAAVTPNDIKLFLTNGVRTLFNNDQPNVINETMNPPF